MGVLDFLKKKEAPQICDGKEAILSVLYRMENRQKEAMLLMEDIEYTLQEETGDGLLQALISVLDTVYDFVLFAEDSGNGALSKQAAMMFSHARRSAAASGLTVVCVKGIAFDRNLHTIAATEQRHGVQSGHILQTLRCGYIHHDKIVRLAEVLVSADV